MTLDELIPQLQLLRAEIGGAARVYFPDDEFAGMLWDIDGMSIDRDVFDDRCAVLFTGSGY